MSDQSAKQMISMKKNGFVYNGVSKPKEIKYSPIYGYQDLTVSTLDEAVQQVVLFVPGIEAYADQARRYCHKENPELTLDESAAIYLYTMPTTSFHSKLNDRLRAENRNELEPWLAFLKLFISALRKLPSTAIIVWRGVASDICSNFVANDVQTWWTVNSCSMNPRVVEFYLGGMGTVFGIQAIHGKDISKYSACPHEEEVVLMPGTRVRVMGQPFEVKDKPYVISLKEWYVCMKNATKSKKLAH
jgi:hypothetical protein